MNFFKKTIYGLIKKNRHLPMDFYARIFYEYTHGEKLDLKNPVRYNQKIAWLKVYFHPPILNQLVDKYEVRSYVKEKIGDTYLNELYQVCDSYEEIDFKALPNTFIIKGTHGSNMYMISEDKSKLNRKKLKFLVFKWKRKNLYYSSGQEWAYKNVKPRIIIEKFLEDKNGELIDFKLFCFDGEVKFIQAHKLVDNIRCVSHYDLEWNKLNVTNHRLKPYEGEIEKPNNLNKMFELALKLANKLPFVRVDLYNINNNIIFSELTFYPGNGKKNFYPESFNQYVAELLKLPVIPEGQDVITSWE